MSFNLLDREGGHSKRRTEKGGQGKKASTLGIICNLFLILFFPVRLFTQTQKFISGVFFDLSSLTQSTTVQESRTIFNFSHTFSHRDIMV
jgi:hypothetical protein